MDDHLSGSHTSALRCLRISPTINTQVKHRSLKKQPCSGLRGAEKSSLMPRRAVVSPEICPTAMVAGSTCVLQPGHGMPFLCIHALLSRKNPGIGCSQALCLTLVLGHELTHWRSGPTRAIIHQPTWLRGLLQHKYEPLPCADSLKKTEWVQRLSVMSHYLF